MKQASKRLHFMMVMSRNGLPVEDLVEIYNTLIRPCLEYGNVLLVGCTAKQRDSMDRVQKRAIRIITRNTNTPVLLPDLQTRREEATIKLMKAMHQPSHSLNDILPPTKGERTGRDLRNSSQLSLTQSRNNRLGNSTIPCGTKLFNCL